MNRDHVKTEDFAVTHCRLTSVNAQTTSLVETVKGVSVFYDSKTKFNCRIVFRRYENIIPQTMKLPDTLNAIHNQQYNTSLKFGLDL